MRAEDLLGCSVPRYLGIWIRVFYIRVLQCFGFKSKNVLQTMERHESSACLALFTALLRWCWCCFKRSGGVKLATALNPKDLVDLKQAYCMLWWFRDSCKCCFQTGLCKRAQCSPEREREIEREHYCSLSNDQEWYTQSLHEAKGGPHVLQKHTWKEAL